MTTSQHNVDFQKDTIHKHTISQDNRPFPRILHRKMGQRITKPRYFFTNVYVSGNLDSQKLVCGSQKSCVRLLTALIPIHGTGKKSPSNIRRA